MTADQSQKGGEASENYQAGRDIVFNGMSFSDVREISLDVLKANYLELFEANFLRLRGIAEETARARAEKITGDFLDALFERVPEAISSARDPDMQRNLIHAQREFACSGEEDLESVLVDLLVDRAARSDRDIKTLSLNEAIVAAPRLTRQERATLAIICLAHDNFDERFFEANNGGNLRNFKPFVELMATSNLVYGHMAAVGVGYLHTDRSYDVQVPRYLRGMGKESRAGIRRLVNIWETSLAQHFTLTPAGIAIGQVYWKIASNHQLPTQPG